MLSEDDLIDIVSEALAQRKSPADWRAAGSRGEGPSPRAGKWGFHVRQPFNAPWTSLPVRRPFISEYMARKMADKQQDKEIRIPANAILSPLAEEWLAARGIAVRREQDGR